MLVQFSVANFRSFRDKQVFSMAAGRKSALDERKSLDTGSSLVPKVLRSAVILGPNGSGKSNLLLAMKFLRDFVKNSFANLKPNDPIDVSSYRLGSEIGNEATEFEIIFVVGGYFYQFGFECNSERVTKEWLFSKPNTPGTRIRTVYEREFFDGNYVWRLNESILKGEREAWKSSTRQNALFISTAVHLNAESLKSPYDWMVDRLTVTNAHNVGDDLTSAFCKHDLLKERVLQLLRSVDVDIADIEVTERKLTFDNPMFENFTEVFRRKLMEKMKDITTYDQVFTRLSSDGRVVRFRPEDESSGTMSMFSLVGPWIDVLEYGSVLVIDELQNNLHPLALRHMAKMFENPEINRYGAQLVFTTHDTSVLLGDFVSKDQIWLVDRPTGDPSTLYPLSDFDIREGEALHRGYLGGRYGALPRVREELYIERSVVQEEESDS